MDSLRLLQSNLIALGPRRLIVLGMSLVSVVALILLATYSLGRPSMEALYTGLDPQDVSRIGSALRELGIVFDVSVDEKSVQVPVGSAARARMLLAERGLPKSPDAGYELFDSLGPLGLTSFMQEVTRVRALEGELARTIQLIDGIRAARVHLVLQDPNTIRRDQPEASASVVIRTDNGSHAVIGQAIRQLVAAAVPSLKPNQVTVMTTDGSVLASGNDAGKAGPSDIVGLERSVSEEIQDKIRMTLAPYLGLDNFRSSVTVKLNTDRHQINETKFDPDSKVERSVRVTKETGSVRDTGDAWQTTVEQNIPSSTANAPSQKVSSQDNQRRDETTTYEISSTTTAVESNGYAIDALSVAVVINRQALLQGLGGKAAPEAITAQVQEIQNLVSTAAGLKSQRGDTVKIMTVDFQPAANQIEPAAALGIGAFLADRAGLLVNATTMLIIAALVTMLGIRPATRMLLQRPEVEGRSIAPAPQRPLIAGSAPVDEALLAAPAIENAAPAAANLAGGARGLPVQSAQRRLQQLVESNEEGAAGILRDWIREATPQ